MVAYTSAPAHVAMAADLAVANRLFKADAPLTVHSSPAAHARGKACRSLPRLESTRRVRKPSRRVPRREPCCRPDATSSRRARSRRCRSVSGVCRQARPIAAAATWPSVRMPVGAVISAVTVDSLLFSATFAASPWLIPTAPVHWRWNGRSREMQRRLTGEARCTSANDSPWLKRSRRRNGYDRWEGAEPSVHCAGCGNDLARAVASRHAGPTRPRSSEVG